MSNYKLTREDFISTLSSINTHFRNGEFKIVGEYKGVKKKILIKDIYGYHRILVADLLNGKSKRPTIKSALFRTQYLNNFLSINLAEYYKRYFRIIGEQAGKYKIIDRYSNIYLMPSSSLLSKNLPRLKTCIDKDTLIINKLNAKNENFKSGKVKYLRHVVENQKYYIFVEDEFGLYKMDLSSAYSGSIPTIEIALDKDENLRNRLSKNGGDYDYSKSVYNGMKNKADIICNTHGLFKQKPHAHIRGEGCPKCGDERISKFMSLNPTGWSHTNWVEAASKSKYFDSFKCYVIKICTKDFNECFYKIGRTYTSLKRRFHAVKDYEVVEVIKIFKGDAHYVINKEIELLRKNKEHRYNPINIFRGSRECFYKIDITDDKI